MDLNKYWADVRAVMAKMPRARIYYLTSLDHPDKGITAGRVMDIADPKMAARRIVDRTHRESTPAEIAQFEADQERQAEELATIELNRKGQLAMPKDVSDMLKRVAQQQSEELTARQPDKKKEK